MTLAPHLTAASRPGFGRPSRVPVMGRAMIVHRSDIVSAGIASILSAAGGMESVTLVPSVYEAFRVARSNPPRVILFEYDPRDGSESTSLLSGIVPRPALVALVSAGDSVTPGECLAAGADAVVAIDNVRREMFHGAVRSAMTGTPSVVVGFPAALAQAGSPAECSPEIADLLTPRERQLLYLIGEGLTNREIAEVLVLSVKTVETHRANLSRKLNIRSRAGLMRLAMSGAVIAPAVA
jgi:DNA-binding NarL/FixJ family response regulator